MDALPHEVVAFLKKAAPLRTKSLSINPLSPPAASRAMQALWRDERVAKRRKPGRGA